jgi:ribonuclease BN (tRNA processing enzyme)
MSYSLTIIGSASGQPVPDRAHASLALHRPGEIHLLDAGEGACSALLRWGLDPLAVKSIFITHTHPDHCVGIFMILQYMHMKEHPGPVIIYLPESAITPFQTILNQFYLVPDQINTEYLLLPLNHRHELNDTWLLETFPTQHLKTWEELRIPGVGAQAYAFRVSSSEHSLFYSGDISDFGDIAKAVNKDDLLILEGAHIDVDKVLNWALKTGLRRLVLTHILPGSVSVDAIKISSAQVRGLEILVAQDGMTLSF